MIKNILVNCAIFVSTILIGLGLAELALRLKNSNQKNYNIEMWRYSKLLKKKSDNPLLGHEHVPNRSARLQGVDVRINSLGMRGPDPAPDAHSKLRVLFLGSSNTLGWGVDEDNTMTAILQKKLGARAQIYNAGIGNYNAQRYVGLFDKRLREIQPNLVVINFFIRDAEILAPGGGNAILRSSQLAVIVYHLMQGIANPHKTLDDLVAYYRKIYQPDSQGRKEMEAALDKLDALSKEIGFEVIFTMIPDIHLMKPYPFEFINATMRDIAEAHKWTFVDFTEDLSRVDPEDLWAMPGDPHVNGLGHQIMAQRLSEYIK